MISTQRGDTNMLKNRTLYKTVGIGMHHATLQSIITNRLLAEDFDDRRGGFKCSSETME